MKLHSSILRETTLVGFLMCISSVLALKLWPVYVWESTPGVWGDLVLLVCRPSWKSSVNLIPLGTIFDYYNYIKLGTSDLIHILVNRLENFISFIPIGFFPALLFRDSTWKRSFKIGLGLSLFVECGQYFVMRGATVDDVILTTLGALSGYWLFKWLKNKSPHIVSLFQCTEFDLP